MGIFRKGGMTLIELVVALALSVLVLGAVYQVYKTQQRHYYRQTDISAIHQEARYALWLLSREIRMAGFLCDKNDSINLNRTSYRCGINGNENEITVVYAEQEIKDSEGKQIAVEEIEGEVVTLNEVPHETYLDPDNPGKRYVAFEGLKKAFEVIEVNDNRITLSDRPPEYLENMHARVFGIRAITYDLREGTLRRDENTGGGAQPLTGHKEGFSIVEELRFKYSEDGKHYTSSPTDPYEISGVNITLKVKSPMPDPDTGEFYERTFETTVRPRNLGGKA